MRGGFPLHVEKIFGNCTVKKVSDFPGDDNIANLFLQRWYSTYKR